MDSAVDLILTSLEETITRTLVPTKEVIESDEIFSELDIAVSKSISSSEVAMKQVLWPLFDNLCYLQEQSVLGCLMLGMANQMACRLVFMLKNSVCIEGGLISVKNNM